MIYTTHGREVWTRDELHCQQLQLYYDSSGEIGYQELLVGYLVLLWVMTWELDAVYRSLGQFECTSSR